MNKIKLRQICFLFIGMMPITKLLMYPSILPYYAKNDVVLSAAINFILQGIVIGFVLWLSKKTDCTFFQLLQNTFGKIIATIIYIIFILFLLFSSFMLITEQKAFVINTLYENTHTYFNFMPFFIVSFFACSKGLKTIGRVADLCMPIFLFAFIAIIGLSLSNINFSSILPIGGGKLGIFKGNLISSCWYTDCLYPLFFLGHFQYEKKSFLKIGISYGIGAICVMLFLAIYYGLYGDITILRQNSIAHIAKFTTAFTSIGRVDYVFVFTLTLVHVFYTIVPLQFASNGLIELFPKCNNILASAIINFIILLFIWMFTYDFSSIQIFYSQYFWIFASIFAYILPICAIFLKKERSTTDEKVLDV